MHNRFFRVTAGPIWEQFLIDHQQRIVTTKAVKAFMKKIGADNVYGRDPQSYSFTFPRAKRAKLSSALWTKNRHNGSYYPRKAGNESKALCDEVAALPPLPSLDNCLQTVGLWPGFPALISGGRGYSPHVRFYSLDEKIIIVQVPWKNLPQSELDQYKKDNAARIHSSAMHDYLLWKPHGSMNELKEWEALKIMDDLLPQKETME